MEINDEGEVHVVDGRAGAGVLGDDGEDDEAEAGDLQRRLVCSSE